MPASRNGLGRFREGKRHRSVAPRRVTHPLIHHSRLSQTLGAEAIRSNGHDRETKRCCEIGPSLRQTSTGWLHRALVGPIGKLCVVLAPHVLARDSPLPEGKGSRRRVLKCPSRCTRSSIQRRTSNPETTIKSVAYRGPSSTTLPLTPTNLCTAERNGLSRPSPALR